MILKMRVVRFRQQFDVGLSVQSIGIWILDIVMIILLLECLLLLLWVATDSTTVKFVPHGLFLFLSLDCFVLPNCELSALLFILMFFMLSHIE